MNALRLALAGLFVAASSHAVVHAQTESQARNYPEKAIRFVMPMAPGGSTDVVARIVSNELSKNLGQPVIIDNRPGGDGIVGTQFVARSAPDGYTLLFTLASHTVTPFLHPTIPYDPYKDFAAITEIATQPIVFLANPAHSVTTVDQVVALAKSRPKGINVSHAGGIGRIVWEMFMRRAGIDKKVVLVGYKGGVQAMTAVMSGELEFAVVGAGTAMPYIKSGKLSVIASSASRRPPYLPQVPTLGEAGFPGLELAAWQGLFAPAGTPRPIINKLYTEIANILKRPDVRKRLLDIGSDVVGSSPEQFEAKIKRQLDENGPLVKSLSTTAAARKA